MTEMIPEAGAAIRTGSSSRLPTNHPANIESRKAEAAIKAEAAKEKQAQADAKKTAADMKKASDSTPNNESKNYKKSVGPSVDPGLNLFNVVLLGIGAVLVRGAIKNQSPQQVIQSALKGASSKSNVDVSADTNQSTNDATGGFNNNYTTVPGSSGDLTNSPITSVPNPVTMAPPLTQQGNVTAAPIIANNPYEGNPVLST